MNRTLPVMVTDLTGVIRCLGDEGIPSIVVSEYPQTANFWSRHCVEKVVVPNLSDKAEEALAVVREVGQRQSDRPVVMVGRESDVDLISRNREVLSSHFRIKMASLSLMESLNHKWEFAKIAQKHRLSVPRSWWIRSEEEFSKTIDEIPFPCILKPFSQGVWRREDVYAIIGRWRKAVRLNSREELETLYARLSTIHTHFIVQEFIEGDDQQLFSLHVYCSAPGKIAGSFLGRKIRTSPIHFGRGCYTRSCPEPSVSRVGLEAIEELGYEGPAGLNLKVDSRTGRAYILEINPRFSLWCHLGARSGVNLPLAMYRDCLGQPLPDLHQYDQERRWHYAYFDWMSLKQYRKTGEWTVWKWFRSLLFPRIVFYRWDIKDPMPIVGAFVRDFKMRLWYLKLRWQRLRSRFSKSEAQ